MITRKVLDSMTIDHGQKGDVKYIFIRKATGGGYWKRVK